jgi:hypothetical protein
MISPSRHFIVTVCALLILFSLSFYFFSTKNFFERVQAENLNQVDSYLFNVFGFATLLPESVERGIRIYCDPFSATSTNQDEWLITSCQNQNPAHKIRIGVYDNHQEYQTVLKLLGSEALAEREFFLNESENSANMVCKKRLDYKSYRNALSGYDCVTTLENKEKLYSSFFFFASDSRRDVTLFISVANVGETSSPQEVELELLALVKALKIEKPEYLDYVHVLEKNKEESFSSVVSASFAKADVHVSSSASFPFITKNSGSGIDTTVCNIVDTSSCYPIYCDSITAVWNFSLQRCVEPVVPQADASLGARGCTKDEPIWDGSKCRAIIGDVLTSDPCEIEQGKNSCKTRILWSVENPKSKISIKQPISETEVAVLAQGTSSILEKEFVYSTSSYEIGLFDGNEKLHSLSVIPVCKEGGWSSEKGVCVSPQPIKVKVSGEYYANPGSLHFTCLDASSFVVTYGDAGTIIATGTYFGETVAPITKTGNYSVACIQGEVTSVPVARYYNAPPPPKPSPFFMITPRTVEKGGNVLLNWNIQYPNDTCRLTAKVVCKNDNCRQDQVDYENALNQSIQLDSTDKDDPDTVRSIEDALTKVAPGHIDGDWKAFGQKTLTIMYTTDFTLQCATLSPDTKRVYLRVNKQE